MNPWCRIATPRKEVREGRSFSPDEFAIALPGLRANGGEAKRALGAMLPAVPG